LKDRLIEQELLSVFGIKDAMRNLQIRAMVLLMIVYSACGSVLAQNSASAVTPGESSVGALLEQLQAQVEQMSAAIHKLNEQTASLQAANSALQHELEETRAHLTANSSSAEVGASGYTETEDHRGLAEQKVNDLYQTKVESASRYRVRLSGLILLNMFANTGVVDNIENPVLTARSITDAPASRSLGGTVRQSQIGFQVYGPTLFGAQTSGSLKLDLAGNNDPLNGASVGILRLRTATGRLDWDKTSVIAGQDSLFFLPEVPTSFASLETPPLANSGNLWAWLPQVRVEHRFSARNDSEIAVQAGILDPISGELLDDADARMADAGEESDRPAVAAHISWSRPAFGRRLSIGTGGYWGEQLWFPDNKIHSWLTSLDWQAPLSSRFVFSGSLYRGSAIGGLGGGLGRSIITKVPPGASAIGIFQPLPLDTVGGWAQTKFIVSRKYEVNTAFGAEDPFGSELNGTADAFSYLEVPLSRNWTTFANVIYRPRSNLFLALEYRRIHSQKWQADAASANHINLSMGVKF
jgi:ribonuclease HI